ncbi:MAG: UbiD family decarboxylase [Pirellulales bacterium]|jgi:4-hydroxy-3-polyprenylbenzoate decarboxylase
MAVNSLGKCVRELESQGFLLRYEHVADPHLEIAEIQRRVFSNNGPAILFTNVKDCQFPVVSNLFGTLERSHFIFRNSLDQIRRLVQAKVDPSQILRRPWRHVGLARQALKMIPKRCSRGSVLKHRCELSDLPQIQSWPRDGGPFITLPQVFSQHPDQDGLLQSNLGMYRVQLAGGDYLADQVGLHYQIHRGIGVHQQAANELGKPLKVNIFVGGSPAMTVAAVMPLPEGLSELTFAGVLNGERIRMICRSNELPIYADADFCIQGEIIPDELKPEGPFGDHLGYYSLTHDFPVMKVTNVFHREGAIWPFTVVGRPPQEDTRFGELIHEITGPVIPSVLPGVKAVHAVDAAGVHPLLLAIGSERYTPFNAVDHPQEMLTQAHAILGQGQLSLAKYLFILNDADVPSLDIGQIESFLFEVLQRVDWRRDLHFSTNTTIDTLDYSGTGLNQGSKLVVAAAGKIKRHLTSDLPTPCLFPVGYTEARVVIPGVLAIQGPPAGESHVQQLDEFCLTLGDDHSVNGFPLIVIVDESQPLANNLNEFLWVTFTRSNPAVDVHGIGASINNKHWGCTGSLVIDARRKPHHAPLLEVAAETSSQVDNIASSGHAISRYL